MKNLYDKSTEEEILRRVDSLRPDSERLWGKMTVAQMLAHCSVAMEVVMGRQNPPRIFIGRLLSPFLKKTYYEPAPFRRNSPTAPMFVIAGDKDFEKERTHLKALIREFANGGPEKCTRHPHAFFGTFNPEQWSIATYKHFDHHLRQFGA